MKAVLVLIMFLNGEAASFYEPVPAFESMTACVDTFKEHRETFVPENATIRAMCVTDTEVKVLQ